MLLAAVAIALLATGCDVVLFCRYIHTVAVGPWLASLSLAAGAVASQ
jgi:hypothetical protein